MDGANLDVSQSKRKRVSTDFEPSENILFCQTSQKCVCVQLSTLSFIIDLMKCVTYVPQGLKTYSLSPSVLYLNIERWNPAALVVVCPSVTSRPTVCWPPLHQLTGFSLLGHSCLPLCRLFSASAEEHQKLACVSVCVLSLLLNRANSGLKLSSVITVRHSYLRQLLCRS